MISVTIPTDTIIDTFADTVGLQQAESVFESGAREAGLNLKDEYTREEAIAITEAISEIANDREDTTDTFLRTSATTLRMQIRSKNLQ